MDSTATLIFVIAAFGLAAVLIMSKERIPQPMKRPMALISICLVLFAFFLIVYSFLQAGT